MLRAGKIVGLALCALFVAFRIGHAQVAYQTPFVSSITYQNVSASTADVQFVFVDRLNRPTIAINRQLPANAGSSVFVGVLTSNEQLPEGFSGSMYMTANQPIVATIVQIPQPAYSPVKNRPLYNASSVGSSTLYVPSLLKNMFGTTTIFAVQNATNGTIDVTLQIYDVQNPSAPPIEVHEENLLAYQSMAFDAGRLAQLTQATFNGSAVVTAVKDNSSEPAALVGSVTELATGGVGAVAYEAVTQPAKVAYMATALCNAFGGQSTFYAVQNTSRTSSTTVSVTYSNGVVHGQMVAPGAKASFGACAAPGMPAGFSGAAKITSDNTDIVVVGKLAGGGRLTAFGGSPFGTPKLALPYIRWTNDTAFNQGGPQRAYIAIQNVGAATANNVTVKYLDNVGNLLGTHTIASIAASAKANSTPVDATPTTSADAAKLLEFGTPRANANGAFGGSAIIEAPGGQLLAIARIGSKVDTGEIAEDYNAFPIDGALAEASASESQATPKLFGPDIYGGQ
ncbi:MAG TPA: hypothetical protein PKE45_00395 [Caldilineaceae bacterium]|nr:hypothetical protein [Caldilineaceae bacterium]